MRTAKADMATLLHHLKNCPADFLRTSVYAAGEIHTAALLKDTYRRMLGDLAAPDSALPKKEPDSTMDPNHLAAMHIGCWLFSHEAFAGDPVLLGGLEDFLFIGLRSVAPHVPYGDWVRDEDRAEEFIRLALKGCALLPRGESEGEAEDRYDALNTLKRISVLQQSNEALQRIKDIRQKMAEAKAREAANVYGRE